MARIGFRRHVFLAAALAAILLTGARPLEGRTVVLDAGHGTGSGGSYGGYVEAVRMLFLAELLQEELEKRGAAVFVTRPGHADVHLPRRAAMSNRWSLQAVWNERVDRLSGLLPEWERQALQSELFELRRLMDVLDRIVADSALYAPLYMNYPWDASRGTAIHPTWRRVFDFQAEPAIRYNWLAISLHSNAADDRGVSGADVFYSANYNPLGARYFDGYAHQDITRLFGEMLLARIAGLGIASRNVEPAEFLFVRENNLPSVLVENGFHTNAGDRMLLSSDVFMRELARAYADTIEDYFAAIRRK